MIGDGFYFDDVIDGNDTYEVKIANADGSFRTETREAKHRPDFGMSILNGIGSAIGNSLFTTRDERAHYADQRAAEQISAGMKDAVAAAAKTADEQMIDRQERAKPELQGDLSAPNAGSAIQSDLARGGRVKINGVRFIDLSFEKGYYTAAKSMGSGSLIITPQQ